MIGVKQYDRKKYVWISLLLLVLCSNFILYRSPISPIVLNEEANWVILGSLIDLAIISPLFVLAFRKKKSAKEFIILMAGGLIFARLLIPANYFEPFVAVSYLGIAIEGFLILLELSLLFMLVRYMPAIIQKVRMSNQTLLFSFPVAVGEKTRNYPIVKMAVSEFLLFYYALFSWKKRTPTNDSAFTLHKKSSLIAFQIMLIHAIIIETVGIHWWLHEKSTVLSIVLLILNVYSIVFILGDIQAVRLNPVRMTDQYLYLSLGLAKKMVISLDDIESITMDQHLLMQKINKKTTVDFIARDFEPVHPHLILELKKPCPATLLMGVDRVYSRVAIRLDEPIKFYQELQELISK